MQLKNDGKLHSDGKIEGRDHDTDLLAAGHTHHRRCDCANARADGGAYGPSNESASNPASDKADYGFRRNRATHEREGQSYHRNYFH
jgi:hypothetical protein